MSNQILILGFLRSAARYLVRGPAPQLQPSCRRKRPSSDDEWSDGDDDQTIDDGRARGTILITLRNVPPYTEWSASRYCTASGGLANTTLFRDVPKLAKSPPPSRSSANMPNPHYVLFRSFVFNRSDWKGYEHRMTKGESLPLFNAPTERPWASVTFWSTRPFLLCLGQTTSRIREQAQSSCLLGKENIPLSPIPSPLRLDCTLASHLPTAQQIFRP